MNETKKKICFLVAAVVCSPIGAIEALRVVFFGHPTESIGLLDNDPVYYPFIDDSIASPDMSDAVTEDIPVGELSERLGESNVLTEDRSAANGRDYFGGFSVFDRDEPVKHPIVLQLNNCGGINTGGVYIFGVNNIAIVRSDGTPAREAIQFVGAKGFFRRTRRSRKYIYKFSEEEACYTVDYTGKAVHITPSELKLYTEDSELNMDRNIGRCYEPPTKENVSYVSSNEKYGKEYINTMSNMLLAGFGPYIDKNGIEQDPEIVKLPDNCRFFLAPRSLCLPFNIESISGSNICRSLCMPDVTLSAVKLICGQWAPDYPVASDGNGLMIGSAFFGMASPATGPVVFDTLKLPRIAAGGVVLQAHYIGEIIWPEYCADMLAVITKKCSRDHIDLTRFTETSQHLELGECPELRSAELSGSRECCFCAQDLRSLGSITVTADKLEKVILDLRGLKQPQLSIDINAGFTEEKAENNFFGMGFMQNLSGQNPVIDVELSVDSDVGTRLDIVCGPDVRLSFKSLGKGADVSITRR